MLKKRLTSVGVLVDDNASLEAGIAVRRRLVPDVHPHTRVLAIGRCCEVGVVGSRSVLGVEDDFVVTTSARSVVVHFKVASGLIKPKSVQ